MSSTRSKNKRSAPRAPSPPSSSSLTVRTGLFECHHFLAPNEYSDKTLGLLAFLVRQSVGEINFSSIMDEVQRRGLEGSAHDYVKLLEEKRMSLLPSDVSIGKCLMLNRLISYFQERGVECLAVISDVRTDMRLKMADLSSNQPVNYPNAFRQRELDFNNRRNAQEGRRLFYLSHKDGKEPPSLIHLQNRVTEHLTYLLDHRMRNDSKFRETGFKEITSILSNSFMIVAQPHAGVNPVIVYERRMGSTDYTAKVSVTIVCLLHDFMRTHPNLIELYDIEISLWPLSPLYKLDESQTLPWKTCQLQVSPNDRSHHILYTELSALIIVPSNKSAGRIHLSEGLHSLKFAIKVQMNLPEYKFSQTYQIPLESSVFAIASHNNHIPHMLSKVILSDIRRFSKMSTANVGIVSNFIVRYFMHRTGVAPTAQLKNYLDQELRRAQNERRNFQSLEDIFMDFLSPFIYQVEFFAKHPILAMLYADQFFLGICNSNQSTEFMMHCPDQSTPIVGLRMNSIKVDYTSIVSSPASSRPIKPYPCAVRVDIYNKRTNKLQYRTFDTGSLASDIVRLVTTAHTEKSVPIRILSNLDPSIDTKNYRAFTDFDEYYHDRLHQIYRTDEKYKPITNLIENVDAANDEDDDHHENNRPNTDLADIFLDAPYSVPPPYTPVASHERVSTMQYARSDSPFNQPSAQPLTNEQLVQHTLSRPEVLAELLRYINIEPQLTASSQDQQVFQTYPQYQHQVIPAVHHHSHNYGNQSVPQPSPKQNELFAMTDDTVTKSSTNLFQFTTTQPAPSMSNNEDLMDFDDLFTSSN